jgi:hypothetical protein
MKHVLLTILTLFVASTVVTVGASAQTRLDQITAATGTNTINSGNNNQEWDWNTLTAGPAIRFSSTSTASPGSGPGSQTLVDIELSGTNVNSNAVTAALNVANSHGGTTSTNYGIIGTASTGTHNIGMWGLTLGGNAADTGVLAQAIGGVGATYGLQATDDSATGYAGYFNNTNGGYAAAFMGGNVGIGTATPLNLLDIGTSGGIHIGSGVPSSTSMALYNNSGTLTWNGIALATGSSVSGTTNYVPVFTGSSSLGNSAIYQTGGNVGIGGTTPAYPLDILNTSNTPPSYLLRVQSNTTVGGTSNNNALIDFQHFSSAHSRNWAMGTGSYTLFGAQDNFGIADQSSTAVLVIQAGTENVGIGSTSPIVSFDVSQKTDAIALPVGTTGARPSGVNGEIRYNTTLSAVEAYVSGAWTSLNAGGVSTVINSSGRLIANGTTGLKYCPYRGNLKSTPSYGNYTIPSSCLTATLSSMYVGGTASQSAAANTLYYVYLINVSGTTFLDLETTGHTADSSTGIEVMSGNSNRTLVGMIHTDGSSHISSGQNAQTNTVATWDNRIPTATACSFSANRQVTSNSAVEINSENRCYFMSWGDAAHFSSSQLAYYGGTGSTALIYTAVTIDGTATITTFSQLISIGYAGYAGYVSVLPGAAYTPAEGYHYTEMLGQAGTCCTVTYIGGPTTTVSTIQ